jgi:hypothetical protein
MKDAPQLPCGTPEMTEREVAIYNVASHYVGALAFIVQVLEGQKTTAPDGQILPIAEAILQVEKSTAITAALEAKARAVEAVSKCICGRLNKQWKEGDSHFDLCDRPTGLRHAAIVRGESE